MRDLRVCAGRRGRVLLLLVVAMATAFALPARAASKTSARLDALVASHFTASAPGAAVLIRKGDQVLLRRGYGRANLELEVPTRPEYVFRIGSLTKQFTAVAIMMLVEEGKLALDDDVRKYVPEYPKKSATVTVEQLLTHTAGVPDYTQLSNFARSMRQPWSPQALLSTFKELPLEFAPGTRFKYSNSGYHLLGLVIEKASGQDYPTFLREHIFTPLGMAQTRYDDSSAIVRGRAAGYQPTAPGFINAPFIDMELPYSAGGLLSSVDDLARWDHAIAAQRLLKPASWKRIFTSERLQDGSETGYGFGWFLGEVRGHRAVWHQGGIPGFQSFILRLPAEQLLVVVLCNRLPMPDLQELAIRLAGTALGQPFKEPQAVPLAPAALDRHVGVYRLDERQRVIVRRSGDHLTLQQPGQPPQPLAATDPDHFFVPGHLLRVQFTGATGAERLDIDGLGQRLRLPRASEPLPPAPKERATVPVDVATLKRYVGQYQLSPNFVLTISREGSALFCQATGQPRFPIFPASATEFYFKVVDAQLTFHVDSQGQVDGLVLHQNGRDMPGQRIR